MLFTVNFQVIKVDSPYPREALATHRASAVASTLLRRLKFPSEDLMVTIMDEEHLTFFKEIFSPT